MLIETRKANALKTSPQFSDPNEDSSKSKLGDESVKELQQIIASKNISKLDKKVKNMRDQIMNTAKYNYEAPPKIIWNEPELKLQLGSLASKYNINADMEVDSGHSFSYAVIVFFPQLFSH